MKAIKLLWQGNTAAPECRWSEVGATTQYSPDWIRNFSQEAHTKPVTSGPDFARLSPFGGKWYAPARDGSID